MTDTNNMVTRTVLARAVQMLLNRYHQILLLPNPLLVLLEMLHIWLHQSAALPPISANIPNIKNNSQHTYFSNIAAFHSSGSLNYVYYYYINANIPLYNKKSHCIQPSATMTWNMYFWSCSLPSMKLHLVLCSINPFFHHS